MRIGLVGRILAAGAVVVALLIVGFVLFLTSLVTVRDASDDQRAAEESITAAARVQKLVLDLENGLRGYVITGEKRFLEPWTRARGELPGARQDLVGLVAGSRQEPDGRQLATAAQEYVRSWALPVVRAARTDPAGAQALVRTGGGARRVDAIRAETSAFVAASEARAERAHDRVTAAERRAIVVGVSGLAAAIIVFLGVVGYVLRAAVHPLRRLAIATTRVARGNLDTRLDETGAGEVSQLARAFNQMAASLQRSRAELERQANVTRSVLDSTVDGICLTDASGDVVLANRPMLQFVHDLDLPLGGSVQQNLLAVADRFDDPERYREAIGRITPDLDEPTMDEFSLGDGGRCFQGFSAPLHGPGGELAGRVWTLREVTAERVADRLKDDFIATVSHELRTPLTSIVGFVEMLLEEDAGPLTDEQRRFLEIVERSSHRLMRQVGDLLFIAQLDSAGLALRTDDVDLAALVHESVEQVDALARQREVGLAVGAPDALTVRCDRERIAQVVANLLSNAIKFTPAGGRVTVRVAADETSALVEVEDSGIGIPDGERERLFQRFFRSSRSTEQAIQGTGLGLAISHAIVEAHGGSIAAEPAPVEGTIFRVKLPLPVPVEA